MNEKNKILFSHLILLFSFFVNYIPLDNYQNTIDIFDVIFLNVEKIAQNNIGNIIIYSIYYYLLLMSIIYYCISDLIETPSFVSMIVYRIGIKKCLKYIKKLHIKRLLLINISLVFVLLSILFILSLYNYCVFDLKSIVVLLLFIIKIIILFYCLINLVIYYSIFQNKINIVQVYLIIFILIIMDIIFKTCIISYSGIIINELLILLILIFIVFIEKYIIIKKCKRKELK